MRTSKLCSAFSLFAILGLAAGSAAAADSDGDTIDDAADQFPCDANLSTTVYVPAQGAFGSVLYEDNWPAKGDLDFNDAVVAYNYALGYQGDPANNDLTMFTLSFDVMAAGAGRPSGLALSLPIPKANIDSVTLQTGSGAPQSLSVRAADTNTVIDLLNDTKDNFDNIGPFVNTDPALPAQDATQYKLTVRLTSAVQVNPAEAPFDLFFFHTDDPSREIHRPMYEGTAGMNQALFNTEADGSSASRHFVDTDGLPFVLNIPQVPAWAKERVSVDVAYPQVVGFASSAGAQNQTWYNAPVAPQIFASGTGGTVPVAALIPGENGYLPGWADDSCFSCSDGVQNGYEEGVDCGGSCPNACFVTSYSQATVLADVGGHALRVDSSDTVWVTNGSSMWHLSPTGSVKNAFTTAGLSLDIDVLGRVWSNSYNSSSVNMVDPVTGTTTYQFTVSGVSGICHDGDGNKYLGDIWAGYALVRHDTNDQLSYLQADGQWGPIGSALRKPSYDVACSNTGDVAVAGYDGAPTGRVWLLRANGQIVDLPDAPVHTSVGFDKNGMILSTYGSTIYRTDPVSLATTTIFSIPWCTDMRGIDVDSANRIFVTCGSTQGVRVYSVD